MNFLFAGIAFFRLWVYWTRQNCRPLNQPLDQSLKEISKLEAMLKVSTTNTVELLI